MRMSALVGRRYKERPAEAQLDSHAFLLRGAYARQVANGIYSLLPAGLKVARKIEQIIREEMDRIGGQEVLMPVVLPRELWEESGRYGAVGAELLRFTDRTGHDMLLAMTHEEGVVHLARVRGEHLQAVPVHALPDPDEVPRRAAQPRRADPRARVHHEGRLFLPHDARRTSRSITGAARSPTSASSRAPESPKSPSCRATPA